MPIPNPSQPHPPPTPACHLQSTAVRGFDPQPHAFWSPTPSTAALGRLHRTRNQRRKRRPETPPLMRLLFVLPWFRFPPDPDPNLLGRAGTFLVSCQSQTVRGTFWRFGPPIGQTASERGRASFPVVQKRDCLLNLLGAPKFQVGEARGSQPASAWAARADSDSAAEAFASAFPPCARPGRLPLRAPTRFHLLESWGQGEKDPAIDEVSDSSLSPPGSPPAPTTRAAKRRDPTPAAPASPHAHAELDCHSPPELPESPPAPAELSRAVGLPGGSSIPNRPSAPPLWPSAKNPTT